MIRDNNQETLSDELQAMRFGIGGDGKPTVGGAFRTDGWHSAESTDFEIQCSHCRERYKLTTYAGLLPWACLICGAGLPNTDVIGMEVTYEEEPVATEADWKAFMQDVRTARTLEGSVKSLRCGPAALMAVTGCDQQRVEAVLQEVQRDARFERVDVRLNELRDALQLLGYDAAVKGAGQVQLREWLQTQPRSDVCIVGLRSRPLTSHFITVVDDRWGDDECRDQPIETCRYLESTVQVVVWTKKNKAE